MNDSYRQMLSLAAACSLALAGCTTTGDVEDSGGGLQAQGVFEVIQARNASVSRGDALYESIPEAMPQVEYVVNGSEPVSVADAYVVGDLIAVDPGRTFQWTIDSATGEESRREVAFNTDKTDPEVSQASTVHLTLEIERSIVAPDEAESVHDALKPGNTVRVGLTLGAQVDMEAVRAELGASNSFVALLYRPSPVFDYDKELWAILEDGGFLGTISDDGARAIFPAVESAGDQQATFTIQELERPRDEPVRVDDDALEGGQG